jgi:type IV secretory pathway TrbD component
VGLMVSAGFVRSLVHLWLTHIFGIRIWLMTSQAVQAMEMIIYYFKHVYFLIALVTFFAAFISLSLHG